MRLFFTTSDGKRVEKKKEAGKKVGRMSRDIVPTKRLRTTQQRMRMMRPDAVVSVRPSAYVTALTHALGLPMAPTAVHHKRHRRTLLTLSSTFPSPRMPS